jgi:DNA-binding FadR family transcriptional regulator
MRIAAAMRPSRRVPAQRSEMRLVPTTLRRTRSTGKPARPAVPSRPPERGSAQRTYSNRSLHGRLAHRIGMQILRGELPAGAGLPSEDVWSAELDVSRTALREAIKVLAAKGLIESRPRTGARVCARVRWNFLDPDVLAWRLAALPTERYVRDLFDLRQVIEPNAAALAAERSERTGIARLAAACAEMAAAGEDGDSWMAADLNFHQTLLWMTGNEMLGSLGALIETALIMSFRLSEGNPRGQRHALPLHVAVLDAVRAGNAARARDAMLVLLADARKDVASALRAAGRRATAVSGGRRRPQ